MVVITRRKTLPSTKMLLLKSYSETTSRASLKKKMSRRRMSSRKGTIKGSSPAGLDRSPTVPTKTGTGGAVACPGGVVKRRPIRPIDRQKMRDWLQEKLDGGELSEQLSWLDKSKGLFTVAWCHAARHGYDVTQHAPLFKAWATHTEKFKEGDEENHKTWKANFRCALHSVPDIKEVTKDGERKGKSAKRVYQFLDKPITAKKPRKGRRSKKCLATSEETELELQLQLAEESDSGVSTGDNAESRDTPSALENVPDFRQLGISTGSGGTTTTITSSRLTSGGSVLVCTDRESDDCHPTLPPVIIGELGIHIPVPQCPSDSGEVQQTTGVIRTRSLSGDSGNLSFNGADEGTMDPEDIISTEEEILMILGDTDNDDGSNVWSAELTLIQDECVITENVNDTSTDESYTSLMNVVLC